MNENDDLGPATDAEKVEALASSIMDVEYARTELRKAKQRLRRMLRIIEDDNARQLKVID